MPISFPLVASIAAATAAVAVKASFECEKVWAGPSKDNSLSTCLSADHLRPMYTTGPKAPNVMAGVIPLIILVVFLLGYPVFVIGRYCCKCFGSNRRRPTTVCCGGSEWDDEPAAKKEAEYGNRCRLCVKAMPIIITVIAVAPLVLMLFGATRVVQGSNDAFTQVDSVFDFWGGKLLEIRTAVTVDGQLIPPMQESYFTDASKVLTDNRKKVDDSKDQYFNKYVNTINIVGIVVAVVPLVFFIITIFLACCNIRTCFPCVMTFVFLIVLIIYGLVGAASIAVAGVAADGCDEIDRGRDKQPGIVQWFALPTCNSTAPFDSFKNTINGMEKTQSQDACTKLLDICDASPTWNVASSKKIFVCSTLLDPSTQCTTVTDVNTTVNGLTMKSSSPVTCTSGKPCDLRECANSCSDPNVQSSANQTVTALKYAIIGADVFHRIVEPLLSCDYFFDVVFQRVKACSTLDGGMKLLGAGATIFCGLCGWMIVTLFLGQKRWFSPSGVEPFESKSKKYY